MLEKIGFDGFRDKAGIILSDNELRYILWRSYENLAEPGRYRSILGEAADVVKQEHLGVGNYAQSKIIGVTAAEPGLHDKRVVNVFINSSEAPKTRAEALSMLDKMTQPFHNDDQDVDIYVSHRDARHTMQFHNHDQVSLISGIGDLIKHAVKVGEVPVAADEVHTTKAVHIYYGAVNIGGRQYSARLTVKEYYEGSRELNELHLYNALLKKHQANTLSHDGTPHMRPDAKERYKISELIDNTQKNENEFDNIDEYISVH